MAYNPFREGAINAMAPFAGGYEAMLALDALLDYLTEHADEWKGAAYDKAGVDARRFPYWPAPTFYVAALRGGESDQ